MAAHAEWQKSVKRSEIGRENMKYGKSKIAAIAEAEIFNAKELDLVKKDTGAKRKNQVDVLAQKVRQFEEKVARGEQLMRTKDDGGDADGLFEAQTQVDD